MSNKINLNVEMIEWIKKTSWPPVGKGYLVKREDENKLVIRCPRCETPAICASHTVTVKDNKPTLQPSFGCQQCRFHSWLNNGLHEPLTDW